MTQFDVKNKTEIKKLNLGPKTNFKASALALFINETWK